MSHNFQIKTRLYACLLNSADKITVLIYVQMCGKVADWDVYNIKVTLASSLHFISGQVSDRHKQARSEVVSGASETCEQWAGKD